MRQTRAAERQDRRTGLAVVGVHSYRSVPSSLFFGHQKLVTLVGLAFLVANSALHHPALREVADALRAERVLALEDERAPLDRLADVARV